MIILPFSKVLKRLPSILSAQIGKKFNSCRSAEAIKNGLEKMKKERIKEKKVWTEGYKKRKQDKEKQKKQRVEKDKENETEDKKKRDVSKSE